MHALRESSIFGEGTLSALRVERGSEGSGESVWGSDGGGSVAWRIPDESSEGDSPRVRPTNPSGTFTQDFNTNSLQTSNS